jgi:predicted negative regulator of RcsB-dependent stress response
MTWRYNLLFGLIFSLAVSLAATPAPGYADPMELVRFADHLYATRDFAASIAEYRRFLFFHPAHPCAFYANYKAGMAHAALQEWDSAVSLLRRALQQESPEALRRRIRYQLAFTLMAKGDFDLARLELFKLTQGDSSGAVAEAAEWLYGLLLVYQHHWPKARAAFTKIREHQSENAELADCLLKIETLLQRLIDKPQKKSPKLAKRLSTFIPGAGQIYSGSLWSGLNALALNAGTGYLLWQAYDRGHTRDFVLIFSLLWSRYYIGNRLHAEEAAVRANQEYQEKILGQIYALVQEASLHASTAPLTIEWQHLQALQE